MRFKRIGFYGKRHATHSHRTLSTGVFICIGDTQKLSFTSPLTHLHNHLVHCLSVCPYEAHDAFMNVAWFMGERRRLHRYALPCVYCTGPLEILGHPSTERERERECVCVYVCGVRACVCVCVCVHWQVRYPWLSALPMNVQHTHTWMWSKHTLTHWDWPALSPTNWFTHSLTLSLCPARASARSLSHAHTIHTVRRQAV